MSGETLDRLLLLNSACKETLFLCFMVEGSGCVLELSCSRMAWTMGTIMAVVAVLLIHMDKKAVTVMNPSINLRNGGRSAKHSDEIRMRLEALKHNGWRLTGRVGLRPAATL